METHPSRTTSPTIGTALEQAIGTLAPHSPSARADAEILLGHVLGKPRHWPYVWQDHAFSPSEYERFRHLVDRRVLGGPVAYLTGRRRFWSLDLSVTPDVLIPRPETESLVEAALAIIPKAARWRVADLGTGAGPVALALARERPGCRITATDISAPALETARRNARRHKMENIAFQEGSWFDALADASGETAPADCRSCYHVIVSNPPYVAADDPHLSRGDVRFEPALALAGGPDGLDPIRHIARGARAHLMQGGWLLLEHGYDQGKRVRALLDGFCYERITSRRDDGGRERVTLGRYPFNQR
uniref:Release factor glutamine methyltransferase n=1 Tax=Candidatus Kentrum sp. FM TaxID=2126340 RepID=A0A450SUV8_9GAMM|nr:MAG: release factor glutamine methyltransferase [Candidatus Kentron sp. FM]VFJ57755.1 MAG: release factor glutamine methyltransferase [Candidatus Kentron sp. FM]VFK11730.1 MAG: release factor glutamine methyltransferase [Candidatus Kentron sp. FM]